MKEWKEMDGSDYLLEKVWKKYDKEVCQVMISLGWKLK